MRTHLVASGGGIKACAYVAGFIDSYGMPTGYSHGKSGSAWALYGCASYGPTNFIEFMANHMAEIGDVYDINTRGLLRNIWYGRPLKGFATYEDLYESFITKAADFSNFDYSVYCYDFGTGKPVEIPHTDPKIIRFVLASSALGGVVVPYKNRYVDLGLLGMPPVECVAKHLEKGDKVIFLDAYKARDMEYSEEQLEALDYRDYLDAHLELPLQKQSEYYSLELQFLCDSNGIGYQHLPIDIDSSMSDFSAENIERCVEAGNRAAGQVKDAV